MNAATYPHAARAMNPIPIVFENGVFRPTVPVVLPEGTTGEAVVSNGSDAQPPLGCNSPELYAALRQSYDTGEHDLAARVDELDP